MKLGGKIIGASICFILGAVCLCEAIRGIIYRDPWGLTLGFVVLPIGLISLGFFSGFVVLVRKIIKQIKENNIKDGGNVNAEDTARRG